MVATAVYPPGERHLLAGMLGPQFTATVGLQHLVHLAARARRYAEAVDRSVARQTLRFEDGTRYSIPSTRWGVIRRTTRCASSSSLENLAMLAPGGSGFPARARIEAMAASRAGPPGMPSTVP